MPSSPPLHRPVMVEAVTRWVVQGPGGGIYLDATAGAGGHARAILEAGGPSARLVAFDRDPAALVIAREELGDAAAQATFIPETFAALETGLAAQGVAMLDGALFDLGVSSMQLEQPARGFSFRQEGPLDMRMDPRQSLTAATVVNHWSEADLAAALARYGEERWTRRIARAIVRARPLTTTTALAACVARACPRPRRWTRIHPATRTFQALRIVVNEELAALEAALPQAIGRLRPGGRLAVLAYHSLEDRIVKQTFRRAAQAGQLTILTPKPQRPSETERRLNPRCRSARLRVGERRP